MRLRYIFRLCHTLKKQVWIALYIYSLLPKKAKLKVQEKISVLGLR